MSRVTQPPSSDDRDVEIVDPFEDDQRTPVLAVGTRDELAEKAREAARRAAAPSVPNEDVAALAHDLKNPLTIIMLEANQIEQRLALRLTPAVARGLERIAQNASYIDRLLSDLLDMSAADSGRLELRLDRIDLSRLLRDAVGRSVPTQDRDHVRLEIRDVLFVYGDENRLERVVSNLVHNALKYGGDDGGITVRLDARGANACVSVIDSGPGLNADEARVVFDRYRRTKRAATQSEGYGLGLYTSRKIIEAHKGRIGVISQPGQGARFYFELPAIAPHHMRPNDR
ncbi:MAG TPA: HAMP domain-containing sensor histidine kinase [Kofleriaceae bacterium]|nr:HAMP domain-containing sensor histidine kinase [Kofleriaceae bacterium]